MVPINVYGLNISRNFSKLNCLHCHFNSFIYFIVCRNVKCPPVYFVGKQSASDDDDDDDDDDDK